MSTLDKVLAELAESMDTTTDELIESNTVEYLSSDPDAPDES